MTTERDQPPLMPGAPDSSGPVSTLMEQDDVDRALAGRKREQQSDTLRTLPPWVIPAIERAEIGDVALRSRLLGVAAAELGPQAQGPSLELDQDELDSLIVANAIEPRPTLTEYAGERPAIEIERITDPALRAALLGDGPKIESPPDDSEIDGDLFADEGAEAYSGPTGEAQESAPIAGALGQSEIDALLSGATTPSMPREQASAPLGLVIDQGDIDSLIAAARLDNLPAEAGQEDVAGRDDVLDQDELDALFAGATHVGGDMDEPIGPVGDDQALVGDALEFAQSAGDAAETVEAALLEGGGAAPPVNTADHAAREAVGGENVAAVAPDDDLGMSQSALDELLARAKGKAKGEPDAQPLEEIFSPADLDEAVVEPQAPIAPKKRRDKVATPAAVSADVAVLAGPSGEPGTATPRFGIIIALASALRANAARAAASIAVGVAVGGVAYLVMYSNQYSVVRAQPGPRIETATGPHASLAQARRAIDSGMYTQAMAMLDEIIARPDREGGPLEAEYMRLEAWFRSMPPRMTDEEADGFLGDAGRLVDADERHPRAAEALAWEGQVYERADNRLAARTVYRQLVAEYEDASDRDGAMYDLARLDLELKDPDAAEANSNALLEEYPGSSYAPRARLLLGDAALQHGDNEEARRAYLAVADAAPAGALGAEVCERLARLALDEGDADRALEILNRRLEAATSIEGNDRIFLLLARAHRAKGDLESARTVLNELIDFFPDSELAPAAYVELGQLLFELGNQEDALRLSAQAVSRFPGNVAVLKGRGEILARSGQEYEAGVALYEAHQAGANDPALLLAAGRHIRRAGEYERAAKVFEELAEQHAGRPEAFEGRIEHAETLNDQDLATAALDEIETLVVDTEDPRDRSEALSALGRIYAKLGLESAVKGVYEQIAAQTTDPKKLAEAAIAMMDSGSMDEGIAVAARVTIAEVPDETAYALLMRHGEGVSRRDPQLAADKMEMAYSAYPKYRTEAGDLLLLETNLRLGHSARARGIVADAQTRTASNELDPARLERLANTYGDFLYERGDFRAASDAYGIAMSAAGRGGADSMSPSQEWASVQRANALFESGQYAEALPLLDEVAAGTSSWKSVAKLRADAARIELRLRGAPAPQVDAQQVEAQQAG